MLSRSIVIITGFLLVAGSVSGSSLYRFPNESLTTCARKMKEKDYAAARDAALQAPEGGERDFLAGMASYRSAQWEDAARYLARAASAYPLLSDYALFYQAQALKKIDKNSDAIIPLQNLLKNYPDSPLLRAAEFLRAEILYDSGDFPGAFRAYQGFIEKYPSGQDALSALYKSALCREQNGELPAAVTALRTIRLKYPLADVAAKAEIDLQRLAAKGFVAEPYSPEELFTLGTTLYDLRKYDKAIKTFDAIPQQPANPAFNWRVAMKTGQALIKARRFKEAEQIFRDLLKSSPKKDIDIEARYRLAMALDKGGHNDEAAAAFVSLAETSPHSDMADDALLNAAFIRKFQKKEQEELVLLQKLLHDYPNTDLKQGALWESGWAAYRTGNFVSAAAYFKQLTGSDSVREKALYWLGRALRSAGDAAGAQTAFAQLLDEYPFGFYTLTYRQDERLPSAATSPLSGNPCDLLPLPDGYARAKALITFGLYEEAGKELSAARKKAANGQKSLPGLARLYLEMEDYHSALALYRQEQPRRLTKENLPVWGIIYPLAYREAVTKSARTNGVPEWLIYSIIRAESSFLPSALSPAGAMGLMQVMPATAKAVNGGKSAKSDPFNLYLPEVNITLGVKHLKDLLVLYNGDLVAAVAAYNAGAGNVNRWEKAFGSLRRDEFIESIPFTETREYVKKVLAGAEIYSTLYGTRKAADAPLQTPPGQDTSGQPALPFTVRSTATAVTR
jgi:soluble lytic murein transglycosylase